jgi:hypothetical protein
MAQVDYALTYGSSELRGTTDHDGKLTAEIPLGVRQVKLTAGDFEWELRVGDLNPLEATDDDGLSGAQGRLKNLGYFDGAADGKMSPELESALRRFQLQHALPASGALDAATRDALAEKHGC